MKERVLLTNFYYWTYAQKFPLTDLRPSKCENADKNQRDKRKSFTNRLCALRLQRNVKQTICQNARQDLYFPKSLVSRADLSYRTHKTRKFKLKSKSPILQRVHLFALWAQPAFWFKLTFSDKFTKSGPLVPKNLVSRLFINSFYLFHTSKFLFRLKFDGGMKKI